MKELISDMINSKFLTPEERTIIQRFLKYGTPDENILELRQRKSEELARFLDAQVPNTPVTWRTLIKNNEIVCPLEEFLKTLSNLIEDRELPEKINQGKRFPALRDPRLSLLEELDKAFRIHGYSCKNCPGKLIRQHPHARATGDTSD